MEVSVKNLSAVQVKTSALKELAEFVMKREGGRGEPEISVALIGVDEIQELNLRYRKIDRATDVLTFDLSDDGKLCGEVVISPQYALDQQVGDESLEAEVEALLIHGLLHLLGYTHDGDEDSEAMFEKHEELKRDFQADGGTS